MEATATPYELSPETDPKNQQDPVFNGLMSPAIFNKDAGASISMGDANFDGVKHHDINKVDPQNQLMTKIVAGFASAALLLGLLAMLVEQSIVAYIAFAFPLLTAPACVVQRKKIQWLPTFREEHNKLRNTVTDWVMANNRLGNENDRLARQVSRLQGVEDRFEYVVKRERKDVNKTRELVRQNGQIQREMKKLLAAKDMQLLFNLILSSDKKMDERIGEEEMERFLLRARVIYGKNHRVFNEENIKNAFKKSLSGSHVTLGHVAGSLFDDHRDHMKQQQQAAQQVEEPGLMTLRKIPSGQYDTQQQQLEMVQRVPSSDLHIIKIPTEDATPPPPPPEVIIDAEGVLKEQQRGVSVRSTGLVLANSKSMASEGRTPNSIYGGDGVVGGGGGTNGEDDVVYLPDPLGSIHSGNTDILLNGLLSSNSKEYDAASLRTDSALKHGVGDRGASPNLSWDNIL